MVDNQLRNDVCPGCLGRDAYLLETIDIKQLAEVWAREWPGDVRPRSNDIKDKIFHDLQVEEVSFSKCRLCCLEFSHPMRTWSAANYPSQSHGLGFDQLSAIEILGHFEPCSVLEIGCGCGEFLAAANALGHVSLGVDFNESQINKARSLGVDARLMDLKELAGISEHRGKYDVISMFQVIEHLEYPDNLFDELDQLASENARLFIGCPGPKRFTKAVNHSQRVGSSDFWDFPPQHPLRWNESSMRAFLSRKGWRIDKVEDEPLNIVGAAAQLVAMNASQDQTRYKRYVATIARQMQLYAISIFLGVKGVRMFVEATRI